MLWRLRCFWERYSGPLRETADPPAWARLKHVCDKGEAIIRMTQKPRDAAALFLAVVTVR